MLLVHLFLPTWAWVLLCTTATVNGSAFLLQSTLELDCPSTSEDSEHCALYGPDGPWQAIAVYPGHVRFDRRNDPTLDWFPVFPDGSDITQLMAVETGGLYNWSDSPFIRCNGPNPGRSGVWTGAESNAPFHGGPGCEDAIALLPRDASDFHVINASIALSMSWTYQIGNAPTRFNATVNRLGLGPFQRATRYEEAGADKPGLLAQLQYLGSITSMSWSLHLGSAWLRQRASVVLGGYEQNRILGDVAVFDMVRGVPRVPLVDVFLGVEAGLSPFDGVAGSQWRAVSEDEKPFVEEIQETNRAPPGSISVIPNPGVPFISLPPEICNAVASYLPVTWRESFGLFTWNTHDPKFERIINSPAYLGFVFADREAQNHTIKIPFQLLNLTLEAPIVDTPTRYFPCQPLKPGQIGTYQLGRAFLQGAFVGFNHEKDVAYLAQGPGPNMEQSVLRTLEVEEDMPRSNRIDGFEESWRALWTVLQDDSEDEDVSSIGRSGEGEEARGLGGGLSTGAKAGVGVGTVCALGFVAIIAAFLWRRQKRHQTRGVRSASSSSDADRPYGEKKVTAAAEAPGIEIGHELEAPVKTHEAPALNAVHELSAIPLDASAGKVHQ
ncbi:hypothetical protein B0T11DRAFT_271274 [Plectosphaerella cucumerina]|jgi:hypothetical protein|uniref:Peptidase A1 domain-containing protein n=1 Tax=Plectosphaerella cucumerina TaxID=40658 RepID=A0A8K0X8I4_9PEZI|nr:hypothetical protein B0T11DRAFT_271274 [Plectosphaerella cucumerina]